MYFTRRSTAVVIANLSVSALRINFGPLELNWKPGTMCTGIADGSCVLVQSVQVV